MNKRDAKYCYECKVFEQSPMVIGYRDKTFYTNDIRKLFMYGGRLNPYYKGEVTREELRDAKVSDKWIDILFSNLKLNKGGLR